MTRITISLEKAQAEELQEKAQKFKTSLAHEIRWAVTDYLAATRQRDGNTKPRTGKSIRRSPLVLPGARK